MILIQAWIFYEDSLWVLYGLSAKMNLHLVLNEIKHSENILNLVFC